jgi:hypothetical protein
MDFENVIGMRMMVVWENLQSPHQNLGEIRAAKTNLS